MRINFNHLTRTAIVGVFLFGLAPQLEGTEWTGTTGSWYVAANWTGGVPTQYTTAYIDNGGTAQVLTLATAQAAYLIVGDDGSGYVQQQYPAQVRVGYDLVVGNNFDSQGIYEFSGNWLSVVRNVILGNGYESAGWIVNTGGYNQIDGILYIAKETSSGGLYEINGAEADLYVKQNVQIAGGYASTGILRINSGTVTVDGYISFGDQSTGLIEWNGGTLTATSITMYRGSKLLVTATKTFSGSVYVNGSSVASNLGEIEVASNRTLTFTGTFGETDTNHKTITKTGAGTLVIQGTQVYHVGATEYNSEEA